MKVIGGITMGAVAFLRSVPLLAQLTTATISGVVRDTSGAVVPGAEMTIRHVDTGISRTLATDDHGRYLAPNLSLGRYEVEAAAAGFQAEVRSGLALTVGQHAVIHFTLNPGAVAESVTVTGEAPLVETATSSVGALVNREQIHDLPLNGRDYTQLALLQPGVVQYREQSREFDRGMGVRMSISGARHNQVGFRLNGLDVGDASGTTPGSATGHSLGVDAIQEFQVLTNTFSAEYGKAAGGIVNIVHKSGTNELHGSLFEYLRNSALDARNFFDEEGVPPFRRNQFGASLGGPIRRDKTFFFGSYEGLRERLALTGINVVPSQDAKDGKIVPVNPAVKPYLDVLPQPNGRIFPNGTGERILQYSTRATENYLVGKVDHTLTGNDTISVSYTFDGGQFAAPEPRAEIVTYEWTGKNRFQYVTLQETHVFSPTVVNSFRAGFNRSFTDSPIAPLIEVPKSLLWIPGDQLLAADVTGMQNFRLFTGPVTDKSFILNSFQVADMLIVNRGGHSIKLGLETHRLGLVSTTLKNAAGGRYVFGSMQDFLAGRASSFQAQAPGTPTRPRLFQSIFGFFVQDDVRLTPQLNLNAGLRYEFITTPHSEKADQSTLLRLEDPTLTTGKTWIKNPSLKNFAPRLGLAWDVFGNQRTAVRAGFGLYYDQINPSYYIPVTEYNPPFGLVRQLNNPPFPNAWEFIESGTLPALYTLNIMQYDLDQPYRIQYNLGVQQQVLANTAVAVYYVGARGVHSSMHFSNANNRLPQRRTDGRLFFAPNAPQRNPNFASIEYRITGGDSYYNGLQSVLNHRLSGGMQFQASYTWSKSVDTSSIYFRSSEGLNTVTGQNVFEPGSERGLSSFDARHVLSMNTAYDLPLGKEWVGVAKALAGGWQLGGILNLATGHPFTPILGYDNANIITRRRGDDQRPDLAAGRDNNPTQGQNVERYFDDTAFVLPERGTLGNLARNTMIGPGLAQFDFTVKKRFQFAESKRLEFRGEFFNLFNRANFRIPESANRIVFDNRGNRNPSAGRITSTTTTSRQIQFALRLEF